MEGGGRQQAHPYQMRRAATSASATAAATAATTATTTGAKASSFSIWIDRQRGEEEQGRRRKEMAAAEEQQQHKKIKVAVMAAEDMARPAWSSAMVAGAKASSFSIWIDRQRDTGSGGGEQGRRRKQMAAAEEQQHKKIKVAEDMARPAWSSAMVEMDRPRIKNAPPSMAMAPSSSSGGAVDARRHRFHALGRDFSATGERRSAMDAMLNQRDAGSGGGEEQRPRGPDQCRREAAAEEMPRSSSLAMVEPRIKKPPSRAAPRREMAEMAPSSSPGGAAEARRRVKQAMDRFDALRRDFSATGERFAYLAAMHRMRELGQWVNSEVRGCGPVPGVELFDEFSYRAELIVVGLHNHLQAGIACSCLPESNIPIATCIVISGGYGDNDDRGEELVYAGSGGNNAIDAQGIATDQVLTGRNRALVNSERLRVSVRVVRGGKKVAYRYDGLYTVQEHEVAVGAKGCLVFKFLMKRCSGQLPIPAQTERKKPGR